MTTQIFRYRAGGEMPQEVVEGDGGEDRPLAVQQGGGVEHQGQGEEDGGVPGTGSSCIGNNNLEFSLGRPVQLISGTGLSCLDHNNLQ